MKEEEFAGFDEIEASVDILETNLDMVEKMVSELEAKLDWYDEFEQ